MLPDTERRGPLAGALVLAAVVLGACSAGGTADTPSRSTVVHTLPPLTTLTVTTGTPVTESATTSSTGSDRPQSTPPRSSSSRSVPVPTTPLPDAADGSCPYLPAAVATALTGQGMGPSRVIAVQPAPICLFTRSDGGWLAAVRIFRTTDAPAARAAVDDRIPIDSSSPADDPDGWAGGYQPLPSGTAEYPEARSVYGVSKGSFAVIAWTNQLQSIKSRRIVETVITNLHL